MGLHSEVFVVALQELVEVEPGGQEVRDHKQEEDEDRGSDVERRKNIDVGEQLIASNIDDAVH